MSRTLQRSQLVVKKSSIDGYGVFAEEDILTGAVIEECHVLFVDSQHVLQDYLFKVGNEKNAMPLGYGCLYNHSTEPNAGYHYDATRQLMVFQSRRFISKGEEVFVFYGHTWFQSRDLKPRERLVVRAHRLLPLFSRFFSIIALLLSVIWVIQSFKH